MQNERLEEILRNMVGEESSPESEEAKTGAEESETIPEEASPEEASQAQEEAPREGPDAQRETEAVEAHTEEEEAEPEPIEVPRETTPELSEDAELLKKEAEIELQATIQKYKEITGKDFDPDFATLEEKTLFEKIREQIREQLKQEKEQLQKIQRLQLFEQHVAQTEPRYQEIVSFISDKVKKVNMINQALLTGDIQTATSILQKEGEVISKVVRLQQAYALGDVDEVAKAFNEIRKIFYGQSSRTTQNMQKEAPEPPAVEKPGTEPVNTEPQFNPRALGRVKDLSKKAELIPDDLLPL